MPADPIEIDLLGALRAFRLAVRSDDRPELLAADELARKAIARLILRDGGAATP